MKSWRSSLLRKYKTLSVLSAVNRRRGVEHGDDCTVYLWTKLHNHHPTYQGLKLCAEINVDQRMCLVRNEKKKNKEKKKESKL